MRYFSWSLPGRRGTIRLNLKMLTYMVRWIDHTPESFGLLLGRIRRGWLGLQVTVEDFEPFDIATLNGRPKAPPGTEFSMVGLYRRTTKSELRLDHVDATLIETSFVRTGMAYLLISGAGEGPDRATFFISENDEVHGYRTEGEFPFDAEFLQGGVLK